MRITTLPLFIALAITGCVPAEDDPVPGDTSNPDALVITAPANVQKEATGILTNVTIGSASATGGDENYTFTNNAPANGFPLGYTSVIWTVTDNAGVQDNTSQLITITDTTAPTLSAPADIQTTATGNTTVVNIGMATVSDLVDPDPAVTENSPASGFPTGETIVTWTATDASGNTSTASQIIRILAADSEPLTLTPPAQITMETETLLTILSLEEPVTSGGVAPVSITNNAPADGFPIGETAVTWTAIDAIGNTATTIQMVIISQAEPEPLTLTPPATITVEATASTTSITLQEAIASGGVPPLTITNNAPATGFPIGVSTVTWTVVDAEMTTATATQTINITDTTAPSITAPPDITTIQAITLGDTSVITGMPDYFDIADENPSITNNAPLNGFPVGTTEVVWTVTDASGNSNSASQLVTVNQLVVQTCASMVTEFIDIIYPLMSQQSPSPRTCSGCHTGDMPRQTTHGFAFPNNPAIATDFDLFRTIASINSGDQSLVLVKAMGNQGHAGGDRFPNRPDDADFDLFADFASRAAVCQPNPPADQAAINSGTGYEQLHKIVGALASRLPTTDEINTINAANNQQQIDAALGAIIDTAMDEDAFYTRVQELYNDLLLTNRNATSRSAVKFKFDIGAFANFDYFEDNFTTPELNNLRENTNYGLSRAPIELIKYVVKNNLPFTEILTADYTMINPYSAVIYDNDAGDPDFPFNSDNIEANHDRDDFRPVNNIQQQDGTLVPAAGVIGTHAFLERYLSTSTNINRGRSFYVFNYFLGIDIESLASRDGLDLDNVIGSVPTFEDPQCTICHNVMDPVAGLFSKRNYRGKYRVSNNFQHNLTLEGVPRMVPAGYTLDQADQLPESAEDAPLQWLGMRLADDDRFAEHTVRTVLKGFTGIEATTTSTTTFVNQTKNRFINANYDFKLLVKDIISSEYFLARNLAIVENPDSYVDIGPGRLLTPEELNRKIIAVTGSSDYEWQGPNSHSGLTGKHNLLYGGIDSAEVTKRITEPTSLINGIQERISNQVACERVAADLYSDTGTLFPFVDETDTPENAEDAIRQNIQFLHRHILGEELALDSAEIEHSYQLFLDVRNAGETLIQSQCRGGGGSTDSNGTVIPWMAVVSYLLADYRFFYE